MAGYIGTTPVPQATQHRESFTATGGQTSFATAGYTPQFIDVYLNGVKLAPADYTATNGSDVVLASGATASDILEIVAYTPFEVANQTFTGTTTAANLTVTGAFTSQGIDDNADAVAITIDSSENVGIGNSTPSNNHANANNLVVGNGTAGGIANYVGTGLGWYAFSRANANNSDAFDGGISYDGSRNLMFHTNAGSERMRIGSAGNVGLGTTSIAGHSNHTNLFLGGTGAIHVEKAAIVDASLHFSQNAHVDTDGSWEYRITDEATNYYQNAGTHVWRYAASGTAGNDISWSEAMRIDTSGNLLVGKPSTGISTVGAELKATGELLATVNNDACAFLNRKSSDGTIIALRKDGTTVGSIKARSSFTTLQIGSTGTGITGTSSHKILPSVNNARSDNTNDLGDSSYRWKDLYLSGGVYLGGTGSANKISDYEEGTWTPTVSEGNVTAESAWYVKVGKLVTVSAKLDAPSNNSNTGSLFVEGLPFTTKASNHTSMGSMMGDNISGGPYFPYVSNNSTDMRFYAQTSGGFSALRYVDTNSSTSIYFTITYHTQ
jgi:hypothetical protein